MEQRGQAPGTQAIVRIQRALGAGKSQFWDKYFEFWSFCAEEEFYLVVLPALIWNGKYQVAEAPFQCENHLTMLASSIVAWA